MRILLIFVLLLQSSIAYAEAAAPERARAIGLSGLKAYSDGAWTSAYERFAEANELAHSPVFVLYMARCKRNSGQLLKARELLRAVARETLADSAPAPWQQAVASAHAELGTVQQSIPSLWLRADSATEARVAGRTISVSQNAQELELDPGEYVIEYRDRRGARAQHTVQLVEGRRRVPVLLSPEKPKPAPKRNDAGGSHGTVPSAPTIGTWRRTAGWAALGVGAAGVGLGIVSGLMAKGHGDQLRCTNGHCLREDAAKFETASDWAAVSTVSFIFSGSSLLSGAALLLLPASPAPGTRAGVTVQGTF